MTDLLVLGSGVAGLTAAVHARHAGLSVSVLTKGEVGWSATRYAQGGVAAALFEEDDSAALHGSDTMTAGGGLCDADAVGVLASEGPARVRELMDLGARFDRVAGDGRLALAREGGHSVARVVHAGGDATGAEIERALVAAVEQSGADVHEGWLAIDLLVHEGRAAGVIARDPSGNLQTIERAAHRDRHRWRGPVLRGHDQSVALDRRRHRDGPARRCRGRRPRVHAVPPHRAAPPVDAPAVALRSAARRGRDPPRRARRRVHGRRAPARRSRAARRRGTRDQPAAQRARPRPPLARRHRDPELPAALPDDRALRARASGSIPRATGSRWRRPRTTSPVACAPISTARRRSPGCGRAAKRRARVCTAPTGSRRTRCSTVSCSAPVRSKRSSPGRTAPSPPACSATSVPARRRR